MPEQFDAYFKWLGIPPAEQPAHHYRLLGVPAFVDDLDVIENAADQRMAHVRTFQSGQHSDLSQRILNEIAAAKVALLNPEKKAAYDAALKKKLAPKKPLARAEPLKQAQPLAAAPEPINIRTAPKPTGKHRTPPPKPAWQNPLALGGVVVGLVLLVGIVFAITRGGGSSDAPGDGDQDEPRAVAANAPRPRPQEHVTPPPEHPRPPAFNPPAENKPPPRQVNTPDATPSSGAQSIDLLKQIDPTRDVVKGTARVSNGVLVLPSEDDVRVKVRHDLPEEYVLTFVVVRKEGIGTLNLGLVVGDHQVLLTLDGWGRSASQLWYIDGEREHPQGRWPGKLFDPDKPVVMQSVVRRTGISITADGEKIIDYQGGFDRLAMDPYWAVDDKSALSVGAVKGGFHIRKLTVAPLEETSSQPGGLPTPGPSQPLVATGPPVDLLGLIDPARDAVKGSWRMEDGVLVSPDGRQNARVQIPYPVPPEYQVEVVLERTAGDDVFTFGLVGAGRQFSAFIDSGGGVLSGLQLVDGKAGDANVTTRRQTVFQNNKRHTLRYRVSESGVSVSCDGVPIISYEGSLDRLSNIRVLAMPRSDRLFLACWDSVYHIHKIALTPLGRAGSSTPAADGEVVYLDDLQESDVRVHPATKFGKHGTGGPIQWPLERIGTGNRRPEHALVIHPLDGQQPAFVQYDLSEPFQTFQATVTPLTLDNLKSALTLRVLGDGKVLWQSEPIEKDGRDALQTCDVDVVGVKQLTLQAQTSGAAHGGWAVWVNPRLTRAGSAEPPEQPFALAGARLPLPDQQARQAALEVIEDVFQEEYQAAKSPEQQAALAKVLFKQAKETRDDPAGRFMLLVESRRLAIEAADTETALSATEWSGKWYEIEVLEAKVKTLEELSKTARFPAQKKPLAEKSYAMVDEALATGRYETAEQLLEISLEAARRVRNTDFIKQVVARRKEVDAIAKEHAAAQDALATLEQEPDDPRANLIAGRFLCLMRGDWQRGLPLLAKGANADLRAIAAADLAAPTDADEQASVGDAWWELAEEQDELTERQALRRAAYWYQKALRELTGLKKVAVEERLKKLGPLALEVEHDGPASQTKDAPPIANAPFAEWEGTWVIRYQNNTVRTYTISADGSVVYVRGSEKRTGTLRRAENAALLDFRDGNLERLILRNGRLEVEFFYPATHFPDNPTTRGAGTRTATPSRTSADRRPDDAVKLGEHYYKLFDAKIGWANAQQNCKTMGGHLAYIETEEEWKLLAKLVAGRRTWLGGYRDQSNETWRWGDGRAMAFTAWRNGHPASDMTRQHRLRTANVGGWVDVDYQAGDSDSFLCEWDE